VVLAGTAVVAICCPAGAGGQSKHQSLRILSVRKRFTASFCLVLSLLTRSASRSGGRAKAWGCPLLSLLKGDLGDL